MDNISKINPRTKLPITEEESHYDVWARHSFLYSFIKKLIKIVAKFTWHPTAYSIENIPKQGGAIVACNHRYYTGTFTCILLIERKIFLIGKSQLFRKPTAWFYRNIGVIPIDRSKRNKNARNYVVELLRRGELINIYPEGTINRASEMLPFKFGAVSMAKKAGVPIIPTAIFKHKIVFGLPMKVTGDLETANRKLREAIETLLNENTPSKMRNKSGKDKQK
ncbi:MAG: 1-acyl-sn-glycerol-3-phosphate acyltransferase [Candidatus Nomurabacteria bacterium]|jgi:1-acyl-sn-glycerol-3-phosphate acyltransferase|nr:1-acyl-sn-glycerol-3-phosphate acyltransferase [Candidatus Nomurabacteria bacterium]